jgi:hypothetical protein
MKTLKTIQEKLIKYYSQTQNDLELLYDKTILLHSTIEDTLFHTIEWKIESEETFWHTMYWDALKNMYHEYKYQTNESSSFINRQNDLSSFKTLNDLLNDDVEIQISSDENEFISYRKQNMWYIIVFILRNYIFI